MFNSGKPDPRDVLIQSLRDEVAYLRQKLDERDKQVLAMTDAQAYRMMHPYEQTAPEGRPLANPIDREPYRPTFSMGEIAERFGEES